MACRAETPRLIEVWNRVLVFLLVLSCGKASAFEVETNSPRWQINAGWHQNTITSVIQSQDGYLWMGSYAGLFRFDGVRYMEYDSANAPGLQNSRITSLFEDNRGVIWIGHETGGLTILNQGKFEPVRLDEDFPTGAVEAMASDASGDLWILSEKGILMRVRDGRKLLVPGGASATRKAFLHQGPEGRVWLFANNRVFNLESAALAEFYFDAPPGGLIVDRIAPAKDGGIWVASGGVLKKWKDKQWQPSFGVLPEVTLTVMHETRSGAVLAGTLRDGFFLISSNTPPVQFSRANGLSHNWVRSVCEDHEGNIWIGSGGGLDVLRTRKVRMLNPPDGWEGCAVMSISQVRDGSAWVATEGAGLYRYDPPDHWTSYGEESGILNPFVWSTIITRDQTLYVGTWGGGFFTKSGDRFVSTGDLARVTAPVLSLYEGRRGELWVGSTEGLHRFEQGKLAWSMGPEQIVLPDVRCFVEGPDGALWFGMSGGGLGRLLESRLTQFRKGTGFPSDFVSALLVEKDGTIWIGTSDAGLIRYRNEEFKQIASDQGLPSTAICHMLVDDAENLWLSSDRGIFRAPLAALHRCADGMAPSVRFLTYGLSEGLASLVCSGGFQPGAVKTAEGFLWFPTTKGIAVIDPSGVKPNLVPPPVLVEKLLANGREVTPREPGGVLRVPAGSARVEINYTALSFAAPEHVRFRHQLEGMERDWMEAGTERSVQYNFLPPGRYTFRVSACNNDDVWNIAGATQEFEVLPLYWQTWWFRSLAGLSLALILGWIGYWASRRKTRRKLELLERQRALERERSRIARDIHDDLGASLTRISMLSQTVRGDLPPDTQSANDVDQIYFTARELTRAMDEIVWAVNPKHDTLDSLVTYLGRYAQNFLSTAGVRFRLDVPLALPQWPLSSETRHNLFLVLKEALHNIIKHACATEVRISLELLDHALVIVVVDNGVGCSPASDGRQDSTRFSAGNGINNMRRRIEDVGGMCEWITAPGEGTKVRIHVPIAVTT